MVESVKADNLKEIVVTFNHAVAKDSLTNASFTLKPNKPGKLTAELKEDGKTVVLTVEKNLENQMKYTLTADKVVAAEDANVKLAKTSTDFVAFDATLPEVVNVEFTGPKNVTVTFSEPVVGDPAGTLSVKQDKTTLAVNNAKRTETMTAVNVTLYSSLVEGKTYTVTVEGFQDAAGYKNIIKTVELTYTKDTTAPTASVTVADQKYIVVEFSKPVKGVDKSNFAHTFSGYEAVAISKDVARKEAISSTEKVSKVFVWFWEKDNKLSRPLAQGNNKVIIFGKNKSQIEDLWGNKLADSEAVVNVVPDTEAPDVKEVKVLSERAIQITFTKVVEKLEKGKELDVLSTDGKVINGLYYTVAKGNESSDKYVVDLGKNRSGESFLISLKGVKDASLSANKMADYSATVTIDDKTPPTVEKVQLDDAGHNYTDKNKQIVPATLYVFFDSDVDSTALEASNYAVQNGAVYTRLETAPEFHTNNRIVKFVLTEKEYNNVSKGGAQLLVENVKDLAGNAMVGTTKPINKFNVKPAVKSAVATASNKIVVTFDTAVTGIEKNDFVLKKGTLEDIEVTENAGNTVVTLLVKDLEYETTNVGTKGNLLTELEIPADAVESVAFGSKNLKYISAVVTDRIKPSVTKSGDPATLDVKFDGYNKATIKTDRYLDIETAAAHDFVIMRDGTQLVADTHYTVAVDNDKDLVVTVKADQMKPGNYTIAVADTVNYIYAKTSVSPKINKLSGFGTVAFTYFPPMPSLPEKGDNNSNTTLVVSFDQALYINGSELANDAELKTSFTANGTVQIKSAKYNAEAKTITFDFTDHLAVDTDTLVHTNAQNLRLHAKDKSAAQQFTLEFKDSKWSLK